VAGLETVQYDDDAEPWRKYLTPKIERGCAEAAQKQPNQTRAQLETLECDHYQLGDIIALPPKRRNDPVLRVEQNVGCELPVCVSNRRDVGNVSIQVRVGDNVVWELTRFADSLLPAPEHYKIWLWLLDRFQAALHAGCVHRPRVALNLKELRDLFGEDGKNGGKWYHNVDEALTRFAKLGVTEHKAYFMPDGTEMNERAIAGTLCHYYSWKNAAQGAHKKGQPQALGGWIAPGPMLWGTMRRGYIKALPFQEILGLPYVAQRLVAYLTKHCRPGRSFKVSLDKLLPKIPLQGAAKECRKRLAPHHETLLRSGFFAVAPTYEGRGLHAMVVYSVAG
jgi:hypothetical protein